MFGWTKNNTTTSQSDKKEEKTSFFSWRISGPELKRQIENYHTFKITESYRGISTIIIIAIFGLVSLLSLFSIGVEPSEKVISIFFNAVVMLPVAFFVYKGHRWAIVVMVALITYGVGSYLLESGKISVLAIFIWLLLIPRFWKALKIENERRKVKAPSTF